ncbi:hypothetical protein ACFZCP_14975 [Streptomyces sp. NPDC007971]|uniref:hypothetical protein n=1 Tax=Streptomyces sp. NPDC007971 TaxID=3364799 RepID=UPI0036E4A1D5
MNKPTKTDKMKTLALMLMGCVLLAGVAGLLGHAYHRDPVEWAAWTFATLSGLGTLICFGFWGLEG